LEVIECTALVMALLRLAPNVMRWRLAAALALSLVLAGQRTVEGEAGKTHDAVAGSVCQQGEDEKLVFVAAGQQTPQGCGATLARGSYIDAALTRSNFGGAAVCE
jgi:hypothetical protein